MPADTIVPMIDDEIERLRRIRAILVPLLGLVDVPKLTRPRVKQQPDEPVLPVKAQAPQEPAPPTIVRLPARLPRTRRVRLPKPTEESVALKGAIPTAPVVVGPNIVERLAPTTEPVVEVRPGSFAALVRAAEREVELVS